ncbi:class I SAM-dependent methyltransferase [Candidatus Berkelbacteria bacterium]|nr:class I SAM-dependent methyltransferase [Candidatus Berkelbacteria bacterium]
MVDAGTTVDVTKVMDAYDYLAERFFLREGHRVNPGYLARKALSDWTLLMQANPRGKRVLNVGCSEPIDELIFSRLAKEWVAIDLHKQSLDVAQKILEREMSDTGQKRVTFQVADATKRLPFADESFDISVSFSTIEHIPTHDGRQAALAEMVRVTKRGGHVILTEPNRYSLFYLRHRANQRRGDRTDYGYSYFFTPWELKRFLQRAGLEILEFTSENRPVGTVPLWVERLAVPFVYLGERIGYLAKKP